MPADVVKFGDDLEIDRVAYELRRSGRPLKLERIPMEILSAYRAPWAAGFPGRHHREDLG